MGLTNVPGRQNDAANLDELHREAIKQTAAKEAAAKLAAAAQPGGDHKPATALKVADAAPARAPGDAAVAAPLMRQADSTTDAAKVALRKDVETQDANLKTRVQNTLNFAKNHTFGVKDIIDNFDKILTTANSVNFQAIQADFNSIKNDPANKALADKEFNLLHGPGMVLITSAKVEYDNALDPKSAPDVARADLIRDARARVALAFKDPVIKQHYAADIEKWEQVAKTPQSQQLLAEGRPAAAAAPADAPPAAARPARPNDTAGDAPAAPGTPPPTKFTDQQLAAFERDAAAHTPARQNLENQLWGNSNDPKTAGNYLMAKTGIYNIVSLMAGDTEAQQTEFQTRLFGPGTVTDKQKYVDAFAAKNPDLHTSATKLLQLAGDKLPTVAAWYEQEQFSMRACNALYTNAIAADAAGDAKGAKALWDRAQKYPLESAFNSGKLQDTGVLRIDAKMQGDTNSLYQMSLAARQSGDTKTADTLLGQVVTTSKTTGDYATLYNLGLLAQKAGDIKGAEQMYRDSVTAADNLYAEKGAAARTALDASNTKLKNGFTMSGNDKLQEALAAFVNIKTINAPVDARLNAANALAQIQVTDSGYVAGPAGRAYGSEINTWYKDAATKAATLDTGTVQLIGNTLASAVNTNIELKKTPDDLRAVADMSQQLLGGPTAQGLVAGGIADNPYLSLKLQGAYLLTQQHGTDAVKVLQQAGIMEGKAKGWDMKDVANNDPEMSRLMSVAKQWDTTSCLDSLRRADNQWKTPLQMFGGLAVASIAGMVATRMRNPALLEDAAAPLMKEGWAAAATRAAARYGPLAASLTAASAFSIGVDRMSATHDGILPSIAKGIALPVVLKGNGALARSIGNGFNPAVAESLFGAGSGAELKSSEVLGRMVTEIGGKPLVAADMTAGELATSLAKKLPERNLAALESLAPETRIFNKGVLNPAVETAFKGTSQAELAATLRGALPEAGRFIPTIAELKGVATRSALPVAEGDALALSRQLSLRGLVNAPLAGSARLATEKGVLQRIGMEVTGGARVSEGSLTKQQLLDYAKARSVPIDKLGKIGNVVGEDANILVKGKFNPALGPIDGDVQASLRAMAKSKGGNLTIQELMNANLTEVAPNAGGTVTKKEVVDAMLARKMSADEIARQYPLLGTLSDATPIVKDGKYVLPKAFRAPLAGRTAPTAAESLEQLGLQQTGGKVMLAKPIVPTEQVAGLVNQDPLLISKGNWNPNLLVRNPETGLVTRAIDTPNFKGVMGMDNVQNSGLYSLLAKHGASERQALIKFAERKTQVVPLDAERNMTKRQLVESLTNPKPEFTPDGKLIPVNRPVLTAEEIAQKYPKLSQLGDNDLIVKAGKFQSNIVHRDIPDTMTKRDFIAWYKSTKGIDLADPQQLAQSQWGPILSKASEDANIIQDGAWKVKVTKWARSSVDERNVSLGGFRNIGAMGSVGLKESAGNFLMTDSQANLNAGQLRNMMLEAKLDPSKIEGLNGMAADAPIVVNGKVVTAPQAELSPTARTFTLRRTPKPQELEVGLNEGQIAVLSGEATDRVAANAAKFYRNPIRWTGQYASSSWDSFRNLGAGLPGIKNVTGALDPTAGTFRATGAQYGLQTSAANLFGSLGAYAGFNGLLAGAGPSPLDPITGEPISTFQDFKNKMGAGKSIGDLAYEYMWLPAGTSPVVWTSGFGAAAQEYASWQQGGPAQVFSLYNNNLPGVEAANAAPLVYDPKLLDAQPKATPVSPDDLVPPAGPAPGVPDVPTPAAKPKVAPPPMKQGSIVLPRAAAPAATPAQRLIVTPPRPKDTTAAPDYLDSQLGGQP